MPNYPMHNAVPEPDRSLDDYGFGGLKAVNTAPSTTKPTVPYDQSAPLVNSVNTSSNSTMIDVGPSAGDITKGGR